MLDLAIAGLAEVTTFEVQADSCNVLNSFAEYVYDKLQKEPTPKTAFLVQRVQTFFTENFQTFQNCLRRTMHALIFNENKNIWIYQKAVHSQLVLCSLNESLEQSMTELVSQSEPDEQRKIKILTHLSTLITESPLHSLDSKSRDAFGTKFNTFKTFLYEINA